MSNINAEKDAKQFVNELFLACTEGELPYHNLSTTTEVVSIAKRIAQQMNVTDTENRLLETAAWLAFSAYATGEKTPAKSVDITRNFVTDSEMVPEDANAVVSAVEVANEMKAPETTIEKIIHDAVTFHYGTDDFKLLNKLKRAEYELVSPESLNGKGWNQQSIEVLEMHHYYTPYCQELLDDGKERILNKLKKREVKNNPEIQGAKPVKSKTPAVDKQNEKVVRQDQPGSQPVPVIKGNAQATSPLSQFANPVKGVDTMFRVSSTNNVRVSIMADNKAHIMITVNSIIITVIFGLTVKNLDTHPQYMIPSIMLLVVNVTTIIYSVLATRPGFSSGTFTKEQLENKSVNMLFFGSFSKMSYEDYKHAMNKVMYDGEFMYSCLMKDLYWQGRVLGRKYRLLRRAYTIFLVGLIVSVASFIIAGLISK